MPSDATGAVIARHGSQTWIIGAGKSQLIKAPGAQYVSISPDGTLLLDDSQYFVATDTGRQVGYVHAVIPMPGALESLWLSQQQVVVGSYEVLGLFSVGLNDVHAQVLSANCQLGTFSAQAVRADGSALLCISQTGVLGVLHLGRSPTFAAIHEQSSGGTYISYPVWAPDGSRIVFVSAPVVGSTPPDRSELVIARGDGTSQSVLVPDSAGKFATLPCWSPDGKSLAYVEQATSGEQPTSYSIHVLSLADNHDATLSQGNGAGPSMLAWSPDGKYVAFDAPSGNSSVPDVMVVRLKDGHQTDVANGAQLLGWAR